MTDHQELSRLFESLPFEVVKVAKDELAIRMAANNWKLSEADAQRIGDLVGRTSRTVFRWAEEIRAVEHEAVSYPAEWTFLDRLHNLGVEAFEIDETFLVLYYLCDGNMARLRAEVVDLGIPMPSKATLSRKINDPSIPQMVKDGARHGLRNRHTKQLFIRRSDHLFSDEAWSIDEFVIDQEVLAPYSTVTSCRPHLLPIIDWESTKVKGLAVLPRPANRFDTCAVIAEAAERTPDAATGELVGGLCEFMTSDNGSIFKNDEVSAGVGGCTISLKFSPAYTPTANAKGERAGGTMKRDIVATLGGRITDAVLRDGKTHAHQIDGGALLTWDAFVLSTLNVIDKYNNEDIVERFGCTRAEWYNTHRRAPREIDNENEAIANLYQGQYLRGDGWREFHPGGVKLFSGVYYTGPGLQYLIGQYVQARVLPHRRHRAAVFYEGKFRGWVYPKLDKAQRTSLLGDRYAAEAKVFHNLALADAASERINAAVNRGEKPNPVESVRHVVAEGVVRPPIREQRKETDDMEPQPETTVVAAVTKHASRPKNVVKKAKPSVEQAPRTDESVRQRARRAQAEAFGDALISRPTGGEE